MSAMQNSSNYDERNYIGKLLAVAGIVLPSQQQLLHGLDYVTFFKKYSKL